MAYRRRNLLSVLDFLSPPPPPPPSPPPQTTRDSSSSVDPITSLLIICLILAIVFVVSALLHFLLRFMDRFNYLRNRSSSSDVGSDDHQQHIDSRTGTPQQQNLIDSLPLFTFSAVGGFQKSGDCAVCISRFEPRDQLRLLPNCCHAFHTGCIDTWLASSRTCPLCRSSINVEEALAPLGVTEFGSSKSSSVGGESFRLELGSVSRMPEIGGSRRSYSLGSFDYIVDEEPEFVVVRPTEGQHRHRLSERVEVEIGKDDPAAAPPGADVAEAAGGRGWLSEYVDRISASASSSLSLRVEPFRWSGRFDGIGSNRWSAGSWDVDEHTVGEETGMSQFFRWLAGT